MTVGRFNELIHAPNRLQICAVLAGVEAAEFSTLRELLDVSDSVLSKHIKVLQDAGYVTVRKPAQGPRTTWVELTPLGRDELAAHLAELRRIADQASPVKPA
ncbi:transcriptional regulator [Actinoplanes subglobosus]|uniref:Transcriptional regulator n=1 Tax=Actinoplanes subglobosus TaxID=1547892 RepID=A0ABV8IQG6_9ACTN